MAKLRVLFIGGSGVISSACSRVAVDSGIELFVLNRGRSTDRPLPPGVTMLRGDIREPRSVRDEIKDLEFDAVADWVAFTPEHVRSDIELFRGRTGQYVFISSASAYQTPPARMPVTESTPLRNPFWQYSRDKIACEDLLVAAYREQGFPATIVRPSHTYDQTTVPFEGKWTVLGRMVAGKPVIVHGDGTPGARAVGRDRGRRPGLGRGAAGRQGALDGVRQRQGAQRRARLAGHDSVRAGRPRDRGVVPGRPGPAGHRRGPGRGDGQARGGMDGGIRPGSRVTTSQLPTAAGVLAAARRLADDVLFPEAMRVDGLDVLPVAHLDALAAEGLYGA